MALGLRRVVAWALFSAPPRLQWTTRTPAAKLANFAWLLSCCAAFFAEVVSSLRVGFCSICYWIMENCWAVLIEVLSAVNIIAKSQHGMKLGHLGHWACLEPWSLKAVCVEWLHESRRGRRWRLRLGDYFILLLFSPPVCIGPHLVNGSFIGLISERWVL